MRVLKGNGLTVDLISQFLKATYDKNPIPEIGNFKLDTDISNETSKVYWNGSQAVLAVRGTNPTMNDWSNNLSYALGTYKQTPRFKEAEDAFNKTAEKYGKQNITTLGHSQGGGTVSFFPESKEIITLNRAYKGEAIPQNEYDIHSTWDPVSTLLNVRKPPNDIPIKSVSWNPLTNHSIDVLNLLPQNQIIGKGLDKEGGLTDKQISILCNHYKIPLKGIFIKDEIHKLQDGNYIINLNGQSHWTALVKDRKGIYYMDSFGFVPPQEIEDISPVYHYNTKQIQDINSVQCGYYAIAFLKFLTGQPNKLMLFNLFCDLFKNDTRKNDKILKSLF